MNSQLRFRQIAEREQWHGSMLMHGLTLIIVFGMKLTIGASNRLR
jgi:hypothetical protein